MGLDNHGPRSRRSLRPMLEEVARFYESGQRQSHKLYRLSTLLTSDQVGALLGVRAGTLSQWRRRHEDFPSPLLEGQPYVWDRRRIWDWARKTGARKARSARPANRPEVDQADLATSNRSAGED
jgi:hypothetical protein